MQSSEEAQSGLGFQVIVPADLSIQQLRDEAKAKYGLDIHIRLKVGPSEIKDDGSLLDCPMEAVDDKFLEGQFTFPIPEPGYCLYIGYFLPAVTG